MLSFYWSMQKKLGVKRILFDQHISWYDVHSLSVFNVWSSALTPILVLVNMIQTTHLLVTICTLPGLCTHSILTLPLLWSAHNISLYRFSFCPWAIQRSITSSPSMSLLMVLHNVILVERLGQHVNRLLLSINLVNKCFVLCQSFGIQAISSAPLLSSKTQQWTFVLLVDIVSPLAIISFHKFMIGIASLMAYNKPLLFGVATSTRWGSWQTWCSNHVGGSVRGTIGVTIQLAIYNLDWDCLVDLAFFAVEFK